MRLQRTAVASRELVVSGMLTISARQGTSGTKLALAGHLVGGRDGTHRARTPGGGPKWTAWVISCVNHRARERAPDGARALAATLGIAPTATTKASRTSQHTSTQYGHTQGELHNGHRLVQK